MTRLVDNRTNAEKCQALRAEFVRLTIAADNAAQAGQFDRVAEFDRRIDGNRRDYKTTRARLTAAERMDLFCSNPMLTIK